MAWVFPIGGAVLYYFFGINRIERKAARLRRAALPRTQIPSLVPSATDHEPSAVFDGFHLNTLRRMGEKITRLPLTRGNRITPLFNGDQAFPAMLSAIDRAEHSVGLSTYIFEFDPVGQQFIESLGRAVKRGVQVRVLIDDVGSGFKWRSIFKEFSRQQIPAETFMPTLVPWRMVYFNLRNHRKILTVDGRLAFTGGMNITSNHLLKLNPKNPAKDVHFQVEGPVVNQIQDTFRLDWHFTSGEDLGGEAWFPSLFEEGLTYARGISDGPDEDFEKTKLVLLGAMAQAKQSIRIVTPYLIPDMALISGLNLAAMSGLRVDVVLPAHSDMAMVNWATEALLWQILQRGVHVWRVPAPFNHAKLMVVDGAWTLFGSSNWDHRSLRLNFEFNVECYGRELAGPLDSYVNQLISTARPITLEMVDGRPLPQKIRDGIARLFSPML
ncbi:MAG: Major cardiolipin synthase ClsA [Elusimicrobia bacterium]|nr:Major cardiolipin synthase ClsA [Elusimicrobiota bacterium]